jgi:hypothetical protein
MGGHPTGVAVDPLGEFVYVVDLTDEFVRQVPLDDLQDSAVRTIPMTDAIGAPTLYARFVEVDPSGDRLFVAHDLGRFSIVDVPSGNVIARSNVAQRPGDMDLLGGMVAVSDPPENEVKLVFASGGVATHSVPDQPTGIAMRIENNGLRVDVTQLLTDRLFTIGTGTHIPTGQAPVAVDYSPDEDVLVVANRGDQSVTVFRSSPVTVSHPDIADARQVVIGPRLPPPPPPSHRIVWTGLDRVYAKIPFVHRAPWKVALELARLDGDPRFELVDDDCSGRVLGPEESCSLLVAFEPPEERDGEERLAVITVEGRGDRAVREHIVVAALPEDAEEEEGGESEATAKKRE